VADRIDDLIVYGLPPDYFDSYAQRVDAVTLADVERVADRYLDPGHFAIVIVGDRATVEAALRELPYPVEVVPVEAPAAVGGE
jgi:predicted Zn-dependent peptidase